MGFISIEERRRVFRNELYNLKEMGYITPDQYSNVSEAHNEYFTDILAKKHSEQDAHISEQPSQSDTVQQNQNVIDGPNQEPAKSKPAKVRPKKTAEEIRERNISWSLNIGVIMLLIGGLFVATSNWETMTPLMKAGSIAMISALFYGIAYVSYRILKIEKTAFAFVVLGSLFLPIFTLSLGWFELLGAFLSFNGEGRFILGMISSFLLIPVYALLANKLSSRLFVWFSFIASSASAAYLLRAIGLETDGFYLGMMVFNTLLISGFHQIKKKGVLPLFSKELAIYSQANLVLSTLLMLLFFENHIFYGFNLILTAVIYLSMIYVNGRKEYHFIFTVMFVYGAYQIFENWHLQEASIIGYALLGFVFLMLHNMLNEQFALKRAFQWSSAAVSGVAFLMITVEGMLMRSQDPSLILFFAYLIIAVNFIYLANTNNSLIFRYLSPIFLASALYEALMQLDRWFDFETLTLPIYFIGFTLFTVFGWQLKAKYFKVIQISSRDIGMLIMLFTIPAAFALFQWWQLGLIFFLNAFLFYFLIKIEARPILPLMALWAAPVSFGMAAASFGEEIHNYSSYYENTLGVPGNFAIASVLLLVASFYGRKLKEDAISESSFFISHGFYASALFFTFTLPILNIFGESIIWFGGILMSFLLYKRTKEGLLTYLTGAISLAWFLITMDSINDELINFNITAETLITPAGSWLLLGAALLIQKRDRILAQGLAWVAHIYLVPVYILAYVLYEEQALWSYLIATCIYALSIFFVKTEWKVKAFLYGSFTTLFLMLKTGIIYLTGEDFAYYSFMAASILIGIIWIMAPNSFKQRSIYYLVPFSLMGISSFLAAYPYTWFLYGLTLVYAVGVLVLLHRVKWELFSLIPLFMIFYATIQIIFLTDIDVVYNLSLLTGFGVVLLLTGKNLYPHLWEKGGAFGLKSLDSYTIVSFLFLISISFFKTETFWAQIVHGLLISAALWLQRNRINREWKEIISFVSGAYLLIPYYTAVEQLNIPALWEREVYVLPFLALVLFLRFVAKGRWDKITSYTQWAVLIIIALTLIQDGLASNTINDALILGSLSLTAMLAGMWLRVKAYFFVGSGVLLLNVMMQTRPYWGNLPWWGYLLIAGTTLISIASFIEWNKQKVNKGERTFIIKWKESIAAKLKKWN